MVVQSYLGCESLKAGAVATGLLSLVYNPVVIYIFIKCIINMDDQSDNYTILQVVFSIMIVLSLLHTVIGAILLKAIYKNKQDLLLMWVIVYTASMIVEVFFTIGLACMVSSHLAFLLLGYVVFMYHTMVVHSLYHKTSVKTVIPEAESITVDKTNLAEI